MLILIEENFNLQIFKYLNFGMIHVFYKIVNFITFKI